MKKLTLMLTLLSTLSFAAADSLGLSGGYTKSFYSPDGESADLDGSAVIGVQYSYSVDELSTVRAGVELFPNLYGSGKLGFGGEVAYLRTVSSGGAAGADVYVGGGLGINTVFETFSEDGVTGSASLTAINPTLLLGVNYAAAPNFGVYAELAGGPSFLLARVSGGGVSVSDSTLGAFVKPRIGLTYTFR